MLTRSSLFQFRHGDHTCVFYQTEDALREVLTPFIADGLRRGERCFCAQKSHIGKRLLFDLRFLGIDTDDAINRGALEIHTEDEVYLSNGRFNPAVMVDMLMSSLDDALDKGFTAFRTAGELSWASGSKSLCTQLVDYEKLVDRCFPGKPAVGLCQYDMRVFSPALLETIVEAHRLHVSHPPNSTVFSGLTIRSGNYCSEIVADKFVHTPNYYYVVQRRQPAEVVGWGIAPSLDSASEKAEQVARDAGL